MLEIELEDGNEFNRKQEIIIEIMKSRFSILCSVRTHPDGIPFIYKWNVEKNDMWTLNTSIFTITKDLKYRQTK